LAARIRALLRRARAETDVLHLGDLRIDVSQGLVTRGDVPIHLTKTEARLLTELVSAHGRIVSREELLSSVWQYDYFGDTRLLDVHIRRLRRKIETDPSHPQYILTVRGVGYRTTP
jgi:DNA-binding response OmpR family regulator